MRTHRWKAPSSPRFLLLLLLQLSCDGGYDPAALETPELCGDGTVGKGELCDTGIRAGQAGACPTTCPPGSPCKPRRLRGSACARQCSEEPITEHIKGDSCCPDGATAQEDSDCGSCGDEVIGTGESCDPPESCPRREDCETQSGCVFGVLTGDPDKCTSRCELRVVKECRSEDSCCPSGCSAETGDIDCSAVCGNGMIDALAGETCEENSRVAPCPTECDDGDPCTRDLMTGSESNCNARCTTRPVTQPINGDQCCPPGANANSDDDCKPACGNGIPERGEECDGGTLCTPDCRSLTPEERACLNLTTAASEACRACSCSKCTEPMLKCYQGDDATKTQRCTAVVECAVTKGCNGPACFCGTSTNCTAPDGVCEMEIVEAAQSIYRNQVAACSDEPSCALYWSERISDCRMAECAAECLGSPAPNPTQEPAAAPPQSTPPPAPTP